MNRIYYILVFCVLFLTGFTSANAQTYKKEGNTFIATSTRASSSSSVETKYQYKDTDNKDYTIYMTKNGKAFINRVSKKSGKEYKKYLPDELALEIANKDYPDMVNTIKERMANKKKNE